MIYHVYANRSNIGDWLSAKGIQKLLHPLPVTECLCDTPFVEETMNILSAATPHDLIVIGGGGLIMDYFVSFWEAFQHIIHRVSYVIWGIGCCDLKDEATLPPAGLMEKIAAQAILCVVRDELTKKFLRHVTMPAPVACPSINCIAPYPQHGNGILHVSNFTTVGAEAYEAMRAAAQAFADRHGVIFRETNNRIEKDSEAGMNEVLLRYQKSALVISSALHGCIVALAMGLKVMAVSNDRKIDEFMAAVGLSDWTLSKNDTHLIPEYLDKLSTQPSPGVALQAISEDNRRVASFVKNTILHEVKKSTLADDVFLSNA